MLLIACLYPARQVLLIFTSTFPRIPRLCFALAVFILDDRLLKKVIHQLLRVLFMMYHLLQVINGPISWSFINILLSIILVLLIN